MWLSYTGHVTVTAQRCDRACGAVDNFVYLEGRGGAGGWGERWRELQFQVFDGSDCRATFMPPRPDSTGLGPSHRSAGV